MGSHAPKTMSSIGVSGTKSLISGVRPSVRLPSRMVASCVSEPYGLARPRRASSVRAMKVEATAPSPTQRTPSLPFAGTGGRAVLSTTLCSSRLKVQCCCLTSDVGKSLHNRNERQYGQDYNQCGDHHTVLPATDKGSRNPEQNDPLGALEDADGAVDSQALSPGSHVRDEEGRHDRDHAGDDRNLSQVHARRVRQVGRNADEGDAIADPVECRIVEGAELRGER